MPEPGHPAQPAWQPRPGRGGHRGGGGGRGTKRRREVEEGSIVGPDGVAAPLRDRSTGQRISLDTPEDIAKWREERRKRWPSAANVAKKLAEDEARRARGELPEAEARGRGRGRGRGMGRGRGAFAQDRGGGRGSDGRGRGRGKQRGKGRARGGGAGGLPPPRAPTLLKKLLRKEQRREASLVLQLFRHLVRSDFFVEADQSLVSAEEAPAEAGLRGTDEEREQLRAAIARGEEGSEDGDADMEGGEIGGQMASGNERPDDDAREQVAALLAQDAQARAADAP